VKDKRDRRSTRRDRGASQLVVLEPAALRRLRDARADGVSLPDLAHRFGINIGTVKRLLAEGKAA
jgi:DNA-directed RNA polymerase specialized sigma24 family protein